MDDIEETRRLAEEIEIKRKRAGDLGLKYGAALDEWKNAVETFMNRRSIVYKSKKMGKKKK